MSVAQVQQAQQGPDQPAQPVQRSLFEARPAHARQGHLYQHGTMRVLAMESGAVVQCREVTGDTPPWLGESYLANAAWLQPLPMKYFHGELPHG